MWAVPDLCRILNPTRNWTCRAGPTGPIENHNCKCDKNKELYELHLSTNLWQFTKNSLKFLQKSSEIHQMFSKISLKILIMLEKRKTKESIIRKKVSFVPQDFLENSSRILREFFKNSCRLEKILGSSCEILEKNNSVRNLVENEQKS